PRLLHIPRPPSSTLFPYTTLFRSRRHGPPARLGGHRRRRRRSPARLPTVSRLRAGSRARRRRARGGAAAAELRARGRRGDGSARSEEHTSELQSRVELVCRLLLEK